MVQPPRTLPLSGADYFLAVQDDELRKAGLPGNVCRLVAVLEGRLDATRLRAAVLNAPIGKWAVGARLHRGIPFGTPVWRYDPKRTSFEITDHGVGAEANTDDFIPPESGYRDLQPDREAAVAFDLFHGTGGRTILMLTWHHALMDSRGAQHFLMHLDRDASYEELFPTGGYLATKGLDAWRQFRDHRKTSMDALDLIAARVHRPLTELGDRKAVVRGGENRKRIITFTREETRFVDETCAAAGASLKPSLYLLAAVTRALHYSGAAQPDSEGAYVVPVPQNRRKRGLAGPVATNIVTFLFYRIEREMLDSAPQCIEALSKQFMDQVREGSVDGGAIAMEMVRKLPRPLYSLLMGMPSRGRVASFVFSDTGESLLHGNEILGIPVAGMTHLPPVSHPPGIAVISGRSAGRLYFVMAWVDGLLDEALVDNVEKRLRSELLGSAAGHAQPQAAGGS